MSKENLGRSEIVYLWESSYFFSEYLVCLISKIVISKTLMFCNDSSSLLNFSVSY